MRAKKVILYVDAEQQTLSERSYVLAIRRYRVLTAASAEEALRILEGRAVGTLDLLMTTMELPRLDGDDLIRLAKKMYPGLPGMILGGPGGRGQERAWAADAILPEGFDSGEMLQLVKALVAKKRGPKPASAKLLVAR